MMGVSLWSMRKSEFVTLVPVLLSPCASLPSFLPNAIIQVFCRRGLLVSFCYLVMRSSVLVWMMGGHRCSRLEMIVFDIG